MNDELGDDRILQELLQFVDQAHRHRRQGPSLDRINDRQRIFHQVIQRALLRAPEMDPLSQFAHPTSASLSAEPLLGEAGYHNVESEMSELTNEILSRGREKINLETYGCRPSPSLHSYGAHTQSPPSPYPSAVKGGFLVTVVSFLVKKWRSLVLVALVLGGIVFVEEGGFTSHSFDPEADRLTQFSTCAKRLSPRANLSDYHSPESKAVDWLRTQSDFELKTSPCHEWDSSFGTAYAMFLVRHHLGMDYWDLDDGVAGICSHWIRVRCNAHHQVTHLIFNNANLTGTIVTELGGLVHLEHLYLNTNHHLGGSLPSELGTLTALETLQLQQTRVAGDVPTQFGRLTALEQLMLYDTDLFGTVPEEVCALTREGRLHDLVVSCHSALECPCATHCKNADGEDG